MKIDITYCHKGTALTPSQGNTIQMSPVKSTASHKYSSLQLIFRHLIVQMLVLYIDVSGHHARLWSYHAKHGLHVPDKQHRTTLLFYLTKITKEAKGGNMTHQVRND